MNRRLVFTLLAISLAAAAPVARAITTSGGQSWNSAPDAWARGNTADASYFGWDRIEGPQPPVPNAPNGSYKLDDSTPDLGGATTALTPRFVQTAASLVLFGHRSGSGNYYSGFPDGSVADDVFSAVAPASGAGGFTTVVLQALSQPGNATPDLTFAMDTSLVSWTHVKNLTGPTGLGGTVHWQEWTAPGNDLPFSVLMHSTNSSRALDAFQIDTFWTAGAAPAVNARTSIPEPAAASLAALAALAAATSRRRRTAARKIACG